MKIIISNAEIQRYVSEHYGKKVTLQAIDGHTIRIGVDVTVETPIEKQSTFTRMKSMFVNVVAQVVNHVTLNLTVEHIDGDSVTLRHDCGIGKDLLVQAAIKYIRMTSPQYGEAVEELADGLMVIHLNHIEQMKSVLEMTSLDSISFEGDAVVIEATLKST